MNRWRWRSRSTGEPATEFRVSHFLTATEIADLLCACSDLETGTSLSQAAIAHCVRLELTAAPLLEPVDTWAFNYSQDEADARMKWATGQARKFYERTSGDE